MAIGCINHSLNSRPIRHSFKSTVRGARKRVCSPERLRPEKGEKPQARANRRPTRFARFSASIARANIACAKHSLSSASAI